MSHISVIVFVSCKRVDLSASPVQSPLLRPCTSQEILIDKFDTLDESLIQAPDSPTYPYQGCHP